jgi:hypothetical protein
MSAEMASESMEVITMAVDKHAQTKNYEVIHYIDLLRCCFSLPDLYLTSKSGCRPIDKSWVGQKVWSCVALRDRGGIRF